jgi:RimJ/RimL family protein N-acetyltransferase
MFPRSEPADPPQALDATDSHTGARDVRARRLTLPDGREIDVRPIRAADEGLLSEAFARLSPESRYRRFLSPIPALPPGMLRHMTDVDHHDHEALVAVAPGSGAIVGVARFIRSGDSPQAAELAVTVDDAWQLAGVGTVLVALLVDRARAEGVQRFVGEMLWANTPMHQLLREFGAPDFHGSIGVDEFSMPLPTTSVATRIPELLARLKS